MRRCGPTGWTCCGGSGFCGRSRSRGIGRHASRPAISAAGCWCRASLLARTGADHTKCPTDHATAVAYSASVRAHAETVLRGFYEFHLAAGSGPIVNPFPLHRSRRRGRAHAHHNPMEPHRKERTGLYRPTGAVPDSAQHPRRGVQRDLRPAALEPGPCVGGVLRLDRRPRVGAAVGHAGRCGSRSAGDRGGAQGNSCDTGAAGLDGRVRVVAPVSGRDGRSDPQGKTPTVVVDVANADAAVDLSRGASDVRARGAACR